jgi:hypothetical protein
MQVKLLILLGCSALAACGGGGGGGPAADPAQPATTAAALPSTALADNTAPAGFNFSSHRQVTGLTSSRFVADPKAFARPERSYVSIWYLGPDQERRQLALMRLSVLRALDGQGGLSLQVPLAVGSILYEAYDQAGPSSTITGEIKL